ncbi:hypothetical protein FS749_015346 [Ceratobasidium sp. UAMH 11750]|nr:hypothetical protein FS749_015346 [Ceratobasidium sp. UAMH 11750]
MDWLGSEFMPSPLIDPRQTFLVSKFLLDKEFSNTAWAKLSGLEALQVVKYLVVALDGSGDTGLASSRPLRP